MARLVGREQFKRPTTEPAKYGSNTEVDRQSGQRKERGTSRPHTNHKSTLYETLNDEQSSKRYDGYSGFSGSEAQWGSGLYDPQGSEEDWPVADLSYNVLLKSLNPTVPERGPPAKKRRLEHAFIESGVDAANEELGELDDSDDEQESAFEGAEDDATDDQTDPFTQHFAKADGNELVQAISETNNGKLRVDKRPKDLDWGFIFRHPISVKKGAESSKAFNVLRDAHIKLKLKSYADAQFFPLEGLLGHLASCIFSYRDVLVPLRNMDNAEIFRKLACLHSLNHVFKTRDRILKNNSRHTEGQGFDLELQDQGFTRPKVLIVLPTRQSCVRYIETIISLCQPEQQENRKRFQEAFASGVDNLSENKPDDFRDLFAGNDDDMFRLGIKFTRKTLKYFSQFYNSDVIFASPLGLRMAIGTEDPKKQNHDFLSSIEIMVIDQAHALMMQNWEHIEYVLDRLNLQPKELRGCDISRVRSWYLDENAKYLRQTLVFSSFNFPSLNKLHHQKMLNIAGQVKYSVIEEGYLVGLRVPVKQTFLRFDFASPSTEPDDRFKYFSSAVLPTLIKESKSGVGNGLGVLVYIPSYPDFVRLRNFLVQSTETQDISFGVISEYTPVKEVARARSHFFSGRHSVMLYTERAHHFRRYHLKGVKRIVMYGLPENPLFYREIVEGYLGASIAAAKLNMTEASMRALFSKLDMLKLERIVGSSRLMAMLNEKGGDAFDFL